MNARPGAGPEEGAASGLGQLLREGGGGAEFRADAELGRLLHAVAAARPARAPVWLRWALAAALLAAGVVFFAWQGRQSAALTFAANGVPYSGPVTIAAAPSRAIDLKFSDGSVFDVEPATELRVDSSSATGARLTLLDGKATAHVVHRARSSWSVTAGPFEVQVTGTRFGATWDRAHERLSVELYEGSVQVAGGGFAVPIAVRAGQRLEAGKGSENWVLTSLNGPLRPPAPVESAVTPAPSASSPAPPSRSTAQPLDWPAMLQRADFESIVRQANDLGIERCFSTCTTADLRVLADSARYLGRRALAERSLLALRKRSPGEAGNIAFLLARLEESRDPKRALDWYEKSLAEAPNGPYAVEARAGKARLLSSP